MMHEAEGKPGKFPKDVHVGLFPGGDSSVTFQSRHLSYYQVTQIDRITQQAVNSVSTASRR